MLDENYIPRLGRKHISSQFISLLLGILTAFLSGYTERPVNPFCTCSLLEVFTQNILLSVYENNESEGNIVPIDLRDRNFQQNLKLWLTAVEWKIHISV